MSTSRIRVVGVAATVVAGLLCATGSAQAAPGSCDGWQMDTLAQGLGNVENLETDGNGGFFVSGLEAHKLYDIDAAGNVTVVRDDFAYGPGGLQRDGSTLYVSGGMTDGTVGVHALDTATGAVTHVTDLTGNGLLRLSNGDMLTTWIGLEGTAPAGVSAYHHDTGVVQPNWAPVPRAEGLTLSPDGTAVYTDDMITGQIYRIPLDDPGHWTTVGRLGGVVPGDDDLTISQTGILYVAAHVGGSIDRLDPATGATCSIATGISWGWSGPSSVRIGPDGAGWALYVTAFDGTFRRIRPPAGVDLTPVQAG